MPKIQSTIKINAELGWSKNDLIQGSLPSNHNEQNMSPDELDEISLRFRGMKKKDIKAQKKQIYAELIAKHGDRKIVRDVVNLMLGKEPIKSSVRLKKAK